MSRTGLACYRDREEASRRVSRTPRECCVMKGKSWSEREGADRTLSFSTMTAGVPDLEVVADGEKEAEEK